MEENNSNVGEKRGEEKEAKQKSNWEEMLSWVKVIVSAFVIAIILRTFIFQMALVNQSSMDPTLHEGQMLVISKINYFVGSPQRGQIVVLKDDYQNKLLIKRVVGLPGETVELKDGKVYINDAELSPDYTAAPTYPYSQDQYKWTLPEGEYFVMGDNRTHSRDSRASDVGMIDRKKIVGEAVFRLWPFDKLGTIK
jgi:signal peptidase I